MPKSRSFLWIEVDGFHVHRKNGVEQLPPVGLIEAITSITAKGDHQLILAIINNVHPQHHAFGNSYLPFSRPGKGFGVL
jgi:hypothetical protein